MGGKCLSRQKEKRVKNIRFFIQSKIISNFSEIYIYIPKTTLWATYLNLSGQKAKIYYNDHGQISLRHIARLAKLFGVTEDEITDLIRNEIK